MNMKVSAKFENHAEGIEYYENYFTIITGKEITRDQRIDLFRLIEDKLQEFKDDELNA